MRHRGWLAGVVFALLLHAALLWIYWFPAQKAPLGDETLYWQLASALASGADVRVPPLWPPLYAHFVAWLLLASGGSLLAVQLVQTALLVGAAWLARDVVRRALGRDDVANAVGLLIVADPQLAAFAHYLWPEVVHLALFAGALWILAARADRPLWLAALGALLGAALLAKSLLAPFLPVLLLPLVTSGSAVRRLARVALVAGTLGLVVAPTLADNWRRDGVLGIANSGWFNVWVGLNDVSRKDHRQEIVRDELAAFEASAQSLAERNRIVREKSLALVRERGIAAVLQAQLGRQYFRLLDRDSFLTDQLPGGATWPEGRGYRSPPAPLVALLRALSYALHALVLAGAAAGIVLLAPRAPRALQLALVFLAYNAALFLLLHVKTRYRVQLLPFLYVFAAWFASEWRQGRLADRPRARLAGATIAAAAALFLAFGGAWL